MRPRPIIPGGKAGLLVLAAATVPLLISVCKPAAKRIGEQMMEWGEKLKKDAEKVEEPAAAKSSSKADMKATPAEETLKAASPAGKEEVKAQVASTAAKKKAPPKPKAATPKTAKPKAGVTTNPKKPTKKS